MTVQRQYTLPNCNLTLEGLSTGDEADPMAPLTVLLNSECTFPGLAETLSGGREFLEALIRTVSRYAQSLLSGIPYPFAEEPSATDPVTLHPGENHRHQLIATVTDMHGEPTRKTLSLNTVQLFDLMEAVDQLLADNQTLPDLQLQLSPLHRRHARPAEPVSKRIVPAAAGLSALAASAALLFFLPVPEFEPQRPTEEEDSAALVEEAPLGTAATDPPEPIVPGTEETLPREAPDADADLAPAGATDPVAAATALTRLSTAPEITDPELLDDLGSDLETELEDALTEEMLFAESLVYRVAVSETGDLLGYKYENDAALTNIDATPLPSLAFIPVDPATAAEETVAQFRVTFDPDGDVTVEPLNRDATTE